VVQQSHPYLIVQLQQLSLQGTRHRSPAGCHLLRRVGLAPTGLSGDEAPESPAKALAFTSKNEGSAPKEAVKDDGIVRGIGLLLDLLERYSAERRWLWTGTRYQIGARTPARIKPCRQ
jgi:hypothetical protein